MPSTSEFDEDAMQHWQRIPNNLWHDEEIPYRECPNCGRYKFRVLRRFEGSLLTKRKKEHQEKCSNCKYKGDEWVEEL